MATTGLHPKVPEEGIQPCLLRAQEQEAADLLVAPASHVRHAELHAALNLWRRAAGGSAHSRALAPRVEVSCWQC
jgi:hypothetical protein